MVGVQGFTNSPAKKRLLSAFLNFVLFLLLAFIFDRFVSPVTYQRWVGYDKEYAKYSESIAQYEAKQDEFGIYAYDEENNRYKVSDIDETTYSSFVNNEEVIDLSSKINNSEKKLVLITASSFVVSFFLCSLLITLLFSIIFGKYMSFGNIITGQFVINEDGSKIEKKRIVIYSLLRWVCLILLGICTVFLLPISFLYQTIYNEDHRTKLDKSFKLLFVTRS